ncbi:MAG: hypothetical protein PHQ27_01720 [Victivallales bacterium]|nr:hypothetical protein [Victivallales bacterium]
MLTKADHSISIFDLFPDYVMILNTCRQIIFANRALNSLLQVKPEFLVGLRPGEALALHPCRKRFRGLRHDGILPFLRRG